MSDENLRNFFKTYLNWKSTLFWKHQKRELEEFKELFDNLEAHPLTSLQRKAAILNDKRSLVVAGAGTGKTSVIIAKAGYLIRSGKCKPEELLLLAFNEPAAKELEERCEEKLGVSVKAKTFHSIGKEIIDTVEGQKTSVSKLATDERKFGEFLTGFLFELRNNKKTWKQFKSFVIGNLKDCHREDEFKTLLEYKSYARSIELRALSRDLVKSKGELDIANFLFMNGVNFQYEARYKIKGVNYQPDFYLPDYDIYLEHFGIDKNGNTAPYIDSGVYNDQMIWKRDLHKTKGTTLIETYSWQSFDGTLLKNLNSLLKSKGVTYAPRSDEEVFKALSENGYIRQISTLLKTFLAHFKSSHMTFLALRRRAQKLENRERASQFVDLFRLFYEAYQKALKDGGNEIDFNDMIARSTDYVRKGKYKPQWKHIVVDEFQDISVDRYNFVQSLLKANKESFFFGVGDDWQSINRFAGSDISIMSQFRKYFGRATIVNLDRTFRFNDKICDLSAQFVQKNPNQIKKNLVTQNKEDEAQVFLHHTSSNIDMQQIIKATLQQIVNDQSVKGKSLLILARYNHLINDQALKETAQSIWPGEVLEPQSIHKSKGKEADYVIVLGMDSSQYGFPSEITDDPLLSLVLASPDKYPHSEERRLFYVAITRAKQQAHLIYDLKNPSVFITELMERDYEVVYSDNQTHDKEICPECKSGEIIDNGGGFFACTNFPFCKFESPTCQTCNDAHMKIVQITEYHSHYACAGKTCNGDAKVCPKCRIGALVTKKGKYGKFIGCHLWPRCSYTKR